MADSLNDFTFFVSPFLGLADSIAMGTVLAVASCGGPVIPFRGGRVDASVAGPATVPEPHEDLQTHIASFQRQGFNESEMISLVACGHALGGVRKADFLTIMDPTVDDLAGFDTTLQKFDNAVVTEYLDGATKNPLITTANITTQSDLRIFSSDGNVTMNSLGSPSNFSNTCGSLLEKMIDTVPKNVKLTAPIEPFEHKIKAFDYYVNNGTYVLKVALRHLKPNPQRTVTMFWKERRANGSICPPSGCFVNSTTVEPSFASFFAELKGITSFMRYNFEARIPLDSSASKFWFLVNENDGSAPVVVDNDGSGFVIAQDTVLYDRERTKFIPVGFDVVVAVVVAVRSARIGTTSPKITIESYQPSRTIDFLPIISTVDLRPDQTNPPGDGYTFFTGNVSISISTFQINAVVGGKTFNIYREMSRS